METYNTSIWGEVSASFLAKKKKQMKTCGILFKVSIVFLLLSILCFGIIWLQLNQTFAWLDVLNTQLVLIAFFILFGAFIILLIVGSILRVVYQVSNTKKVFAEIEQEEEESFESNEGNEEQFPRAMFSDNMEPVSTVSPVPEEPLLEDVKETRLDEKEAEELDDNDDMELIPEKPEEGNGYIVPETQDFKEVHTVPEEKKETEVKHESSTLENEERVEPVTKSIVEDSHIDSPQYMEEVGNASGNTSEAPSDLMELRIFSPAVIGKIPERYEKEMRGLAYSIYQILLAISNEEAEIQKVKAEKEALAKENEELKSSLQEIEEILRQMEEAGANVQSGPVKPDAEYVIELLPNVEVIPLSKFGIG